MCERRDKYCLYVKGACYVCVCESARMNYGLNGPSYMYVCTVCMYIYNILSFTFTKFTCIYFLFIFGDFF